MWSLAESSKYSHLLTFQLEAAADTGETHCTCLNSLWREFSRAVVMALSDFVPIFPCFPWVDIALEWLLYCPVCILITTFSDPIVSSLGTWWDGIVDAAFVWT